MSPPRTVLFIDLDGTVMTNPFWTAVFPAVFQALSRETRRTQDEIREAIIAENAARLAAGGGDAALAMDWDDIVQTVARRCRAHCGLSLVELVQSHSAPPFTSILDGARDVLARLSAGGQRRLVASSMGLSKYQFPVLRSLGLFDLFDDFLTPDLTGALKTERLFYRRYLACAGKVHLVTVGDKYADDVLPAKQFGLQAVLKAPLPALRPFSPFHRSRHLQDRRAELTGRPLELPLLPDAVIVTLTELEEVIPRLEARSESG